MTEGSNSTNTYKEAEDEMRMKYGFWLILIALGLISALFVFVVVIADLSLTNPADIATALGAVTTLFGTLLGFFFGHQAGSSGKERAENSRRRSETVANMALAHIDPAERKKVMEYLRPISNGSTATSPGTQQHEGSDNVQGVKK